MGQPGGCSTARGPGRERVVSAGPDPEEPVLPEQTEDDSDETGGDWREREDGSTADREEWLQRERPPHWE